MSDPANDPYRFAKNLPDPSFRWAGFPKYNFVNGHNDRDLIPVSALADAAASAIRREGDKLAMYNLSHGPLGFEGLRDFVSDKVARRGITCTREDVLITSGSLQAIDLVNSVLLDPGDTVLVEEFSYGAAITKLRRLGANVVPMRLDREGLDIEALASSLETLRRAGTVPKYIYTIPTVQNPTGTILSTERRRKLIELSARYAVPIFEDECYADLTWSPDAPAAIFSLDPGRVIHIGSFSKSLAPALRIGYIIADWQVLRRLLANKSDGGTGAVEQLLTAEYCRAHFWPHVNELVGGLSAKLDTMIDALEQQFGTSVEVSRPAGGIFVWLKFPDAVDVRKLVVPAAAAGIAFNPGPEWACTPEAAKSHMRLCFGLPSHAEIREGIAALAQVCFEQTGLPPTRSNVVRAG